MPLEAESTACCDAQFEIRWDKRSESRPLVHFHHFTRPIAIISRPYEHQFDEHMKLVHPDEAS